MSQATLLCVSLVLLVLTCAYITVASAAAYLVYYCTVYTVHKMDTHFGSILTDRPAEVYIYTVR